MEGAETLPTELRVQVKRGAEELLVREIRMNDLRAIAKSLITIFQTLDPEMLNTTDGMKFVSSIVEGEELWSALKEILAQVIDKDTVYVDNLGVKDQLTIVRAFFKVNEIGEVKELFLGVMEDLGISLTNLKDLSSQLSGKSPKVTETPTP